MGNRPYIRVYVNLNEIIDTAKRYIQEGAPEITRFEAACTSDPVGIEHITGSLKKTIEFMGKQELGRLRFVTKFSNVESLLDADHNGHTRFRFSVNTDYVIRNFEPSTAPFHERIEAAGKVARAGYPLGFIIAPMIIYDGWEEGYTQLLKRLSEALTYTEGITFELITHRFTQTAKRVIKERYPKSKLEMEEEKRKKKWGRYGRVKYVYKENQMQALERHMREQIERFFPGASIEYFT
jgi:spore photoproduct lyase